jgi:hypothetical protein
MAAQRLKRQVAGHRPVTRRGLGRAAQRGPHGLQLGPRRSPEHVEIGRARRRGTIHHNLTYRAPMHPPPPPIIDRRRGHDASLIRTITLRGAEIDASSALLSGYRTLTAVIDGSYQPLTPDEALLFERLTVLPEPVPLGTDTCGVRGQHPARRRGRPGARPARRAIAGAGGRGSVPTVGDAADLRHRAPARARPPPAARRARPRCREPDRRAAVAATSGVGTGVCRRVSGPARQSAPRPGHAVRHDRDLGSI